MTDIILHHYNPSPYSEKIRLVLGLKQLAWRSVKTPSTMPKPQLQALTGGYRGAPVMQIGADVYCDSALIAAEIDARHPEPPLFAPGASPWGSLVAGWADAWLFWKTVRFAMGVNADALPEAFVKDRAAMRGGDDMFDPASTKADLPHAHAQLAIALDALEHALAAGEWLGARDTGRDAPGYDDLAVYHCLWFAVRADRTLLGETRPRLARWMARVAAIGQGRREEIDAAQAIAIARDATPRAIGARTAAPGNAAASSGGDGAAGDPSGLQVGDRASVRPESFGTEASTGAIVAIDRLRIVLARDSDEAGRVHVHFPRLGYRVVRER